MDCSSWLELLLCVSATRLSEQGQASQHLGHWQFSVDFVVPRTHIDTVSHLLLLSDHCQDMRIHNSLTQSKSHHTHAHTATLTHCLFCGAEFNNCGWLASMEVHLVCIQPNKTHYSNGEHPDKCWKRSIAVFSCFSQFTTNEIFFT